MTAHLAPTAPTTTTASRATGDWAALSTLLTAEVPDLAGRSDLTVTCAPGAGLGAPGVFFPDLAAIELDGKHLDVAPATADPRIPADRERYPVLWGILVHEAGHAAHSRWEIPTGPRTAATEAALMLEESRAEAGQLRRRPADRAWLRAAVQRLILADTRAEKAGAVRMNRWDAAQTAALLLARVDAGVLDADETTEVARVVTKVLGVRRMRKLTRIWKSAHTTSDTHAPQMLALGRRWCEVLGVDPDAPPPAPTARKGARRSALAKAIIGALGEIAAHAATEISPPAPSPKQAERAAERAARRDSQNSARSVFDPHHSSTGRSPLRGTRPPTPGEQAAARRLARALRAAGARERATITTTSATPPGRLSMRGALAADAQRAAGAKPTAEPFTQTLRRAVPTPPLRLGVACDISFSMVKLARPIASAAWILNRAAGHVPDAQAATVTFGQQVQPVTHPGQTPSHVREFDARDITEEVAKAIDALDGALDLSHPGAARLLVIVSDGRFRDDQLAAAQTRITRLIKHGCGVVWLGLDDRTRPLAGAQVVRLTHPADAADAIAQAAVRALRAAP